MSVTTAVPIGITEVTTHMLDKLVNSPSTVVGIGIALVLVVAVGRAAVRVAAVVAVLVLLATRLALPADVLDWAW